VRALALAVLALVACGFASPFVGQCTFVPPPEKVRWRESHALGSPAAGRLVDGVQLPGAGPHYFTWDPLLHRRPDRAGRRWGTDDLVRTMLGVISTYAAEHPHAPRVGVGDLSRPHGGPFGPRHVSHQNGLDVDVYYPRRDRRERPPRTASQINHRLAQALVDLFVRAGAQVIFVGPNTGLTGPPGVVQVLWNHDNHLHVRIYNPARAMGSSLS
jgi:murein endopeptidase